MSSHTSSLAVPLFLIAIGIGWLLTARDVIPGVDWVWVIGLAVCGVLVLAIGGLDKVTVVIGPFLLIATVFSLLRQTERITVDTEIPMLLIVIGALMVVAKFLPVPPPRWINDPMRPRTD